MPGRAATRLAHGRAAALLFAGGAAVSAVLLVAGAPSASGAFRTAERPATHAMTDGTRMAGSPMDHPDGHDPSGHESGEGPVLAAARSETVRSEAGSDASGCDADAPRRRFDVVAIAVDITLNRYGDHDPDGRAYVLASELERVRAEEARNAAARAGSGPVPVSAGLQGDAIQPLTLRVRSGECLLVSLRNDLREPATFHLHGAALRVLATGKPALQTEPSAVVPPGQTVVYAWAVPRDEPSGAHYAHSHGTPREQTGHGLYGAVVVEPAGSRWLDPRSGSEPALGWDAVIVRKDGSSFREFALYYAEVGDETFQVRDRHDGLVPLVDDLTGAYRPATRILSYRSEPFRNRLMLQRTLTGRLDESAAYGSYSFGDPATPMLRAYLGDRVVQRVVHAGGEALHVHHVHGGSVRWARQPGLEPAGPPGLEKRPPLVPQASERTDAQSLAPSETYDVVSECGAGGCQQSVGDVLYHCHVAHHYFGGMWGLWRVYGTLQDGAASTDGLSPLPELPDRQGRIAPAVRAGALIGRRIALAGVPTLVTPQVLTGWLARVLPPAGVARGEDASVWDWTRAGSDVLGEPETTQRWPGYTSPDPGGRPQVLFDPATGHPAYPMLRPHLGKRPPFAPGHGPAPYLDPPLGPRMPAPGQSGPASLCPAGSRLVRVPIKAITLPVRLSKRTGVVDPAGTLFVRMDEEVAVRRDPDRARPLVLRAAAQTDCVDLTLLSALPPDANPGELSKVDLHVHFVQFDVQGSDGVSAGFNFEQSVRPYAVASQPLSAAAPAGATALPVTAPTSYRPGELLALGTDRPEGPEIVEVASVTPTQVRLRAALTAPAAAGERLTSEFVRYRWYPDAQTGTAYFHDHVKALSSWRHGLFGAVVVEPPDATWTAPTTGLPLPSGELADITTADRVGVDVKGSFREYVALLQDDNPLSAVRGSTGGSLGLRVEPLATRSDHGPAMVYSDRGHGPPETAQVRAYVGDPVVFRTLVPGTNDLHTFHLDGHWFRTERWSRTSPPVSTVHLGISERYDLVVPAAGGPQRRAGDYLFGDGRTSKQQEGVWGLLRVQSGPVSPSLKALAGRQPVTAGTGSVCPTGAPVRDIAVSAVPAQLPFLNGLPGAAFVPSSEADAVMAGSTPPTPLVLHVGVGDCLRIRLTNRLTTGRVSLHADLLAADPADSGGVAAGGMADQSVARGDARTSTFYASPEVGEGVAMLRDQGDPINGPAMGLYGAVVVTARGAAVLDATTGRRLTASTSAEQVVVRPRHGRAYRDATVFLQDSDGEIGSHQMPYRRSVRGVQGISYNAAPLKARLEQFPDGAAVFRRSAGEPATPLLVARQGDPLRLHVLAPVSEQPQPFSIDGHRWPLEPGRAGTSVVSTTTLGGLEAVTLSPVAGAGGEGGQPGDYVYGVVRGPYVEAGMWGLLRVLPVGGPGPRRLPCAAPCSRGLHLRTAGYAAAGTLLLILVLVTVWKRRPDRGS